MGNYRVDSAEFNAFANLCEEYLGIRIDNMTVEAHIVTDGYTVAEDGKKYRKVKDSLARTITLHGEKITSEPSTQ